MISSFVRALISARRVQKKRNQLQTGAPGRFGLEVVWSKYSNAQRVKSKSFPGGKASKEIVDALLGPTGNLRAPTVRVGKTLLVGFDENSYADVLI